MAEEYTEEIDVESQKDAMFAMLERARSGNMSKEEMTTFLSMLVNANPYTSEFAKATTIADEEIGVEIGDTGDAAQGSTRNRDITVAAEYADEVLSGKRTFMDAVITMGHENEHAQQHTYKDYKEGFDEYDPAFERITTACVENFADIKLTPEQVFMAMQLYADCFGPEFVEKFENLPEEARKKYIANVQFGNYVKLKYEEEARERSFAFAEVFLSGVSSDPRCTPEMKEWLEGQRSTIEQYKANEKKNREKYAYYENFERVLSKATIGDLLGKEAFIKGKDPKGVSEFRRMFAVAESSDEFFSKLADSNTYTQTLANVLRKTYLKKSAVETMNDYLLAIHNGNDIVANVLQDVMMTKAISNPKIQKVLANGVAELLTMDNIPHPIYQHVAFDRLLSAEQIKQVTEKLVAEGKIVYAAKFVDNVASMAKVRSPLKDEEKAEIWGTLAESFGKSAAQMLAQVEAGDKGVCAFNYLQLQAMAFEFSVVSTDEAQQKFEEIWQQLGTYEQDIKQLAAVEKENQDKIRRAIYGDRAFGGAAPTLDEQRKDTAPIMDNAARELK